MYFEIVVERRLLKVFKQQEGRYLIFHNGHELGMIYPRSDLHKLNLWERFNLIEPINARKILKEIGNVEAGEQLLVWTADETN